MTYSSLLLAGFCARTLDNLKAEHLLALDLRNVDSSPTDYFLICTANSDVHARALADTLARTADTAGLDRPRLEGRDTAEWILIDFFDVVVHIFRQDSREYYKLEKLWGDAPVVDIVKQEQEEIERQTAVTAKPAKKASAKPAAKTGTKTSAKASAKATSGKKASVEKAPVSDTPKKAVKPRTAVKKTTIADTAPKKPAKAVTAKKAAPVEEAPKKTTAKKAPTAKKTVVEKPIAAVPKRTARKSA